MADAEYEIHVLKKGRWTIDHIVSNDKEGAINEAREMTADKYLDGVKVIEEAVINDEGETRSRTVFNNAKNTNKPKKESKPEATATDGKPDKKKKKRSGSANLLIALVVIAVLLISLIILALILG